MDIYLERAREVIEAATGHLSVEQIGRVIPGKWSVAQILEHLTLTFRLNVAALGKALATNETKARPATLAKKLSRMLVIGFGYFPPAEAPDVVTPTGSIAPESIRREIAAALDDLDHTLAAAAERFGEATPLLRHAFFGPLTVPQWRKFHWRHAVHHMRQVRERTRA